MLHDIQPKMTLDILAIFSHH